ncbi:membrane protein insertion efficiency factor YidD [Orbus sturtevantii]|uniref:membrane protein insertion efficiency factor YidD n=1 Tax=Orbus sturtevantii TaxID=3074109 RepID=UPI00370D5C19
MPHFLSILSKYLSIALIRFYQKFISPHKGFCCAYRKYSGGRSCSSFALVAVRRYGVSALWHLFPKRLDNCKMAAIHLNKPKDENEEKEDRTHPCEYCETLEVCSCVKDCKVFDNSSCGNGCHMPDSLPCTDGCGCDFSIRKQLIGRQFSFSPFFLLIWMHKISAKRRGKRH